LTGDPIFSEIFIKNWLGVRTSALMTNVITRNDIYQNIR
jgi:hypothetical protein